MSPSDNNLSNVLSVQNDMTTAASIKNNNNKITMNSTELTMINFNSPLPEKKIPSRIIIMDKRCKLLLLLLLLVRLLLLLLFFLSPSLCDPLSDNTIQQPFLYCDSLCVISENVIWLLILCI